MNETEQPVEVNTVIPFGPQHPVLPEPIQLRFTIHQDKVVGVVPNIGYIHRGIEKACELNDYKKNVSLCERVCGICNFMHAMAYCEAVEELTDTEVPDRAKYLRVVWSELSRLQSHLLWLGLFADSIGFESLFMHIWRDREIVLSLNEKTSGHRIHLSTCAIGGVNKDMDKGLISEYKSGMELLERRIRELAPVFYKDRSVKDRTVGKGVLPKKRAMLLGAVGPTARGSGIPQDMRRLGYEAYSNLDFEPVVHDEGDVHARLLVRLEEVFQSIRLIKECLEKMPEGPVMNKNRRFPNGATVVRIEQPRGELFYNVMGNGTKRLRRCRIRTPTLANIPALVDILVGYDVSDIAPIVMSVDPCISCTER
ncbi:MAG: nickel-dependent hydrogenase large subunit [Candidatus Verstraetearchaeota archaeon]|nr:nickel-dependent hydrogenase large subunit [Candidatus Verstraetearchaeota archaeon]